MHNEDRNDDFPLREEVDPKTGFIDESFSFEDGTGRHLETIGIARGPSGFSRINRTVSVGLLEEEATAIHWAGGIKLTVGPVPSGFGLSGGSILMSALDAEHLGWVLIALAKTLPAADVQGADCDAPADAPQP